jgi:hypothetical protein
MNGRTTCQRRTLCARSEPAIDRALINPQGAVFLALTGGEALYATSDMSAPWRSGALKFAHHADEQLVTSAFA